MAIFKTKIILYLIPLIIALVGIFYFYIDDTKVENVQESIENYIFSDDLALREKIQQGDDTLYQVHPLCITDLIEIAYPYRNRGEFTKYVAGKEGDKHFLTREECDLKLAQNEEDKAEIRYDYEANIKFPDSQYSIWWDHDDTVFDTEVYHLANMANNTSVFVFTYNHRHSSLVAVKGLNRNWLNAPKMQLQFYRHYGERGFFGLLGAKVLNKEEIQLEISQLFPYFLSNYEWDGFEGLPGTMDDPVHQRLIDKLPSSGLCCFHGSAVFTENIKTGHSSIKQLSMEKTELLKGEGEENNAVFQCFKTIIMNDYNHLLDRQEENYVFKDYMEYMEMREKFVVQCGGSELVETNLQKYQNV